MPAVRDSRTLAQLRDVEPDVAEVRIDDSLDKAMASYRHFLDATPANAKTPEAMRRLADLQIEKEYGIMGGDEFVELPATGAEQRRAASRSDDVSIAATQTHRADTPSLDLSETEADFERRALGAQALPSFSSALVDHPDDAPGAERAGPREAIETYQRILRDYPYYERNDQVLYQMARAYDELAEPAKAMEVMERLIAEYGHSDFTDEVYFRRAEYFFVRKKYLDAEESYQAVVGMGSDSDFYELALYKLGWSLYKQELYEDALHQYMALLDYKQSIGYDFDQLTGVADQDPEGEGSERRVADTFRVISLAFSNLGGPDVLNQYFSSYGNRSFEDRIYSNLGEFYLDKLRYNDAATVYRSLCRPESVPPDCAALQHARGGDLFRWGLCPAGGRGEAGLRDPLRVAGRLLASLRCERGRRCSQLPEDEPERSGRPLSLAVSGREPGRRSARQLQPVAALVSRVPGIVSQRR